MDKTELATILAILVGSTIVATQPFNLFPHHELASSIVGCVGIGWMLFLMGSWLGRYSIRIVRN